jgi:hypothetical protein
MLLRMPRKLIPRLAINAQSTQLFLYGATSNVSLRSALHFRTELPDRLNAAPAFHLAPPSKMDLRLRPESVIELANRETDWPEFFDRR